MKAKVATLEAAVCKVAQVCFRECSSHFDLVLGELKKSCEAKTEEEHWEGIPEKFTKLSAAVCGVLRKHSTFSRIAMMYSQAFGAQQTAAGSVVQEICSGASATVKSLSALYSLWSTYGEKLGLGELDSGDASASVAERTLQEVVCTLRRHLSWYLGHVAYAYVKIKSEPANTPSSSKGMDEAARKEEERKQALGMVLQSNLLSGGMEVRHLHTFSKEAKDKLRGYMRIIGDDEFLKALDGDHQVDQELGLAGDEDGVVAAIL